MNRGNAIQQKRSESVLNDEVFTEFSMNAAFVHLIFIKKNKKRLLINMLEELL